MAALARLHPPERHTTRCSLLPRLRVGPSLSVEGLDRVYQQHHLIRVAGSSPRNTPHSHWALFVRYELTPRKMPRILDGPMAGEITWTARTGSSESLGTQRATRSVADLDYGLVEGCLLSSVATVRKVTALLSRVTGNHGKWVDITALRCARAGGGYT